MNPSEWPLSPFHIEDSKIYLAQIIGVLIIAVGIWRFGVPMLKNMLNDRSARIEESHTQVQRALEDIRQLRNDYAARLQSIEVESRQRIEEAVREAEAARGEIIAEARQAATLLKRRSEEEIARERTRQRILLRRQIVQLTLDAAEASVRAHSSDTIQRQLIREFIVGASGAGGTPTAFAGVAPTDGKGSAQTQTQTQGGA
jgi:F0F1-type ATP synthase membrane subunit b/b'